ncbi:MULTISPECIES: hypothetical protein [Paenibacillus]|nr:hypothetical protein [Paenibacillus sp. FSL H8-0259]
MLENVEVEAAEVAEVRVAAVEVVAVVEVDHRRRPVRPPKLRVIGG